MGSKLVSIAFAIFFASMLTGCPDTTNQQCQSGPKYGTQCAPPPQGPSTPPQEK